jgi:hypothetical protein
MSTVSDWSYFTPEGERDAREALATIDHADIRGRIAAPDWLPIGGRCLTVIVTDVVQRWGGLSHMSS